MLKRGESYLVISDKKEEIISLFKENLGTSHGLIVSRNPESKLMHKIGNKKIINIWVTNIQTALPHIAPQKLEQLSYDIEQFMVKNNNSVVLITAVEYLISFTTARDVYHLIVTLRDLSVVNNVLFLVRIGANTLAHTDENLLKQELVEITHGKK